MPGIQANKQWYRYVDNAGRNWAIQADQDWGNSASSGLAAFNSTDPPFGPQSRRHRTRKVIYRDPTTFRSRVLPVGTVAADAALPATLSVVIPGIATGVLYDLSGRVPEKLSIAQTSRNLIDHP